MSLYYDIVCIFKLNCFNLIDNNIKLQKLEEILFSIIIWERFYFISHIYNFIKKIYYLNCIIKY